MDKENINEEWDSYWSPKKESLGKAIINFMREHYFNHVVVSLVGDVNGKTVLEAGSGTSESLVLLSKKAKKTYALDICKDALKISERNFKKKCIARGKYELLLGNINHIAYADNTFDVVFNAGVIEHFTNNQPIKEMIRVTKSGGRVIILVPAKGPYEYAFKIIETLVSKDDFPWNHHKFYSKQMMRRELIESGAEKIKVFRSFLSLGVYMVGVIWK